MAPGAVLRPGQRPVVAVGDGRDARRLRRRLGREQLRPDRRDAPGETTYRSTPAASTAIQPRRRSDERVTRVREANPAKASLNLPRSFPPPSRVRAGGRTSAAPT